MPPNSSPRLSWTPLMAFRDARKSWGRTLMYMSATSIGIGALIAGGSLRQNFQAALHQQAKPLLGADVVIRSARAFEPTTEKLLQALPAKKIREIELNTVMFVSEKSAGRLVEIRAVEPGYPLYGEVKSSPDGSISRIFTGDSVLLDENVMAEFDLKVGDRVQVGAHLFDVAGALRLLPGEAMGSAFAAPRALLSTDSLKKTNLLQNESLARFRYFFKTNSEQETVELLAQIAALPDQAHWRVRTVKDRQESLGRRAANADRFIKLAALMALLLGGLGVASVMGVYAKEKWTMAATLRCLGASSTSVLGIFLFQAACMGMLSALIGTLLGLSLQVALPVVLRSFIRLEIPMMVSWSSILSGAGAGMGLTFLFTLWPLLRLRSVPPLAALRSSAVNPYSYMKDRASWGVAAALYGGLFLLARQQLPQAWMAAAVPLGLGALFFFLSFVTKTILKFIQTHLSATWPYVWRQGLANLFRPSNQSHILISVMGIGAAIIFCISFLNTSLLRHISISTDGNEPTLALIDVQSDQREGVKNLLKEEDVPLIEETPFVTMRLNSINGAPVTDRNDRNSWAFTREYRSTYREHLTAGEKVIDGKWPVKSPSATGDTPISLEEELAETLGVTLGSRVVFDVQGVLLPVTIAALRKVDWFQLRPNFFAVFPTGVLEDAPQFFVILTRTLSVEKTAAINKKLREKFPNVSPVDLRMVLETLSSYLDKVSFALRIMALFVIGTGIMMLVGALLSSRQDRLREAALLRTVGASSGDIRRIHLVEYSLLGLFTGMAGLLCGSAGAYGICRFGLDIPFSFSAGPSIGGLAVVVLLTTATGLFLGRGLLRHPPLQTLREEE